MRKVVIFALLLAMVSAFGQQPQALSAQQVLDKMGSVYASCSSYRDTGEAKVVWRETGRVTLMPFTTAFVRPAQFRHEFQEHNERRSSDYVIWQDSKSVKSWWTIKPDVRSYDTLDVALCAAAGVSHRSSVHVPMMLIGESYHGDSPSGCYFPNLLSRLAQLTLLKEEVVSGRQAYKLKGVEVTKQEITIWIDKEKFLLLKTFETAVVSSQTVQQTTTYKPEINVVIAADKLAFKH